VNPWFITGSIKWMKSVKRKQYQFNIAII